MLDVDIPDVLMKKEHVSESSATDLNIKLKALYFNAILGDWEPFVENFEVIFV